MIGLGRNPIATASKPVFFDERGRRWRHVMMSICIIILIVLGIASWVIPQAFTPVSPGAINQNKEYPRDLVGSAHLNRDIPIIGNDMGGVLTRLDKVVKQDGIMYLTDPFTGKVLRTATDAEAEEIGQSPYILEYFEHPADRQLMLTFDDGPDPKFTPMILDVLAREHVPATFFVLGENVVKYADVFRRVIREGHMVGNHTMTHIDFEVKNDIWNREELVATDRVIRAGASYSTRLFRIPRGNPDENMLAQTQAQQLGYLQVNMDIDTLDWKFKPGQDIPVPPLDGKGHVVLLHDGGGDRTKTVEMLSKLIAEAKRQGYTFSTLQPILPPEYVPATGVGSTLGDQATFRSLQAIWVMPKTILTSLFWVGVTMLSIMSILYLTLALINYRKQNRQQWNNYPDCRMPNVSVVLAAYNEEKVIQKTLDALHCSDYPMSKLEVVVVNDGSTDKTRKILDDYAREWSQLRIIHQHNGGKSSAINNGILQARAESTVIVTLDGDTVFEEDTIRLLVRHFAKGTHGSNAKPIGAVAGHVKVGNRRNILTAWQSLEYISGICVTRLAEGYIDAIAIVPGACSAWDRKALQEIGGLSEDTLAEDADATLQLHRRRYRILQENNAIAHTEAPETVRMLAKQRLRWMYGNIQVLWKHRGMLLRPKYGMLGMVALPHSLLSLLIPLIFLPPTAYIAVTSVASGNWRSVVLFATFVMAIHFLISTVAIVFARERSWHLLIVPVYRLIYEPLRAYLLYASFMRILRGSAVGWNKVERLNSVAYQAAH